MTGEEFARLLIDITTEQRASAPAADRELALAAACSEAAHILHLRLGNAMADPIEFRIMRTLDADAREAALPQRGRDVPLVSMDELARVLQRQYRTAVEQVIADASRYVVLLNVAGRRDASDQPYITDVSQITL
jgi:hypothetical protein